MSRKQRLGADPLAEMIPQASPARTIKARNASRQVKASIAPAPVELEQVPFRIPRPLAEKLRDVVVEDRCTLGELAVTALEREIRRREKARGKAYPKRGTVLRSGRRVK